LKYVKVGNEITSFMIKRLNPICKNISINIVDIEIKYITKNLKFT